MEQLDRNVTVDEALALEPKHTVRNIIIATLVIFIFFWSLNTLKFKGINENGIDIVIGLMKSLVNPNKEWIFTLDSHGVPYLMFETVAIAFLGTLVGGVLAIPFAFLTSRNIVGNRNSIWGIIAITMVRTFPVFIIGLMFIKVVGPGPFAGVLTIGVSSIGMITKLYIEAIEDIDSGIIDALDSAGCNTIQKIRYGIIPQLSASFISTAIYRFEINARNATVLGLVGAGGIGAQLIWAMGAGRWNDAAACLLGIVVVVVIIEFISTSIRTRLTTGE
jgi:phosphonate transport system permease protein